MSRRVALIIIAIALILFMAVGFCLGFMCNSLTTSAQAHHNTKTAVSLYGHTVDRDPIFVDAEGTQYIVPWLDSIGPDEVVVLEFTEGQIMRAWIAWEAPNGNIN